MGTSEEEITHLVTMSAQAYEDHFIPESVLKQVVSSMQLPVKPPLIHCADRSFIERIRIFALQLWTENNFLDIYQLGLVTVQNLKDDAEDIYKSYVTRNKRPDVITARTQFSKWVEWCRGWAVDEKHLKLTALREDDTFWFAWYPIRLALEIGVVALTYTHVKRIYNNTSQQHRLGNEVADGIRACLQTVFYEPRAPAENLTDVIADMHNTLESFDNTTRPPGGGRDIRLTRFDTEGGLLREGSGADTE